MIEHEITRAYRTLREATQRKREADFEIASARSFLKDMIPQGTSIVGVLHLVHDKRVVHYSDAMEKIIMTLVPKGSRVRAWEIISEHTHIDTCHSFENGGSPE